MPSTAVIAIVCASGFASAGTLVGVVRDASTAHPIPNAVVRFSGTGTVDATDSNGIFSFPVSTSIRRGDAIGSGRPRYDPELGIVLANSTTTYTKVEILDLSGKIESIPHNSLLEPGVWAIPATGLGKGRHLCRIRSAGGSSTFAFSVLGNAGAGGAARRITSIGDVSAARALAAAIDTLVTSKPGYLPDTSIWSGNVADTMAILLRDTSTTRSLDFRTVIPLDTNWLFHKGNATGADKPAFADASWRRLDVPHDWSIEGPFEQTAATTGYGAYAPSGVGWYRKRFHLPAELSGRRVFVEFDGVMANSSVYINGTALGTRPSGYTSFRYEFTGQANFGSTENVISVKADDSPQPASRWYTGAGIYRHVRLIATDPVHIGQWATFVTTPSLSAAHVQTTVANQGGAPRVVSVEAVVIDPAGARSAAVTTTTQAIAAGASADFALDVPVPAAKPWSLEAPNMYRVVVTVRSGGAVVDEEATPFGFRTIKFDPELGFFLNGKSVKMKGVCLHHDVGGLGAAAPLRAVQRRLAILKGLGVNAIRTSHNPVDPQVMDLYDRMGFLVLDEFFDVWTEHKYNMPGDFATYFDKTNPATGTKWYQSDLVDDVRRDRNHPSVVFYSIGNEIHDGLATRNALAADMVGICHKNDPTRPVTQALLRPNTAGDYPGATLDILDVFGVNYRSSELLDAITATRPHHSGVATEMTKAPKDWTDFYLKHPQVVGEFLWTGADYLGEEDGAWPVLGNGAGLIDRVGGIKDIGYQYQAIWSTDPVVKPKTSTAAPARIAVTVDHPSVATDNNDVAYVKASVVDATGVVVSGAANPVTFQMSGTAGEIIAFDSGNREAESFMGPSRKASNGICYAVVRMKSAGAVTVTASSPGLAGGSVAVTGVDKPFVPCSGSCD